MWDFENNNKGTYVFLYSVIHTYVKFVRLKRNHYEIWREISKSSELYHVYIVWRGAKICLLLDFLVIQLSIICVYFKILQKGVVHLFIVQPRLKDMV